MSGPDASFSDEERAELLAEVREYLPAFLQRDAAEQHDPVGDVSQLLNLEREDLERVVAVHRCLAPAVLAFGAGLRDGLRRPLAAGARPPEVSRSVRGPIDWAGTSGRRALAAGDPSIYVVRTPRRSFDNPENRALAWLLNQLSSMLDAAVTWRRRSTAVAAGPELGWAQRLDALRAQLEAAKRINWLSAIAPERPEAACLRRVQASRSEFYAGVVAPALESVLRLANPSPERLVEVLAERYFVPSKNSQLFEVVVALRLARAFAERSPRPRRTRLLVGEGRSSFARYAFEDGSEVTLMYQAWPETDKETMRRRLGQRHDLGSHSARPDIVLSRAGPDSDTVVLELKASQDPAYLRRGLVELLGYLADHPDLWGRNPSAWLVAPASDAFRDELADAGLPLWIVSADRVATAAVERFAGLAPAAGGATRPGL